MAVACRAGMTPFQFWDLTPRELQVAAHALEETEKAKYNRMRWGLYYQLTPYAKKGFKPSQIWLPIDAQADAAFETHGKVERLDRHQLAETWKKAGFKLSDEQLERIYGKQKG
jgi:hypothetical protein